MNRARVALALFAVSLAACKGACSKPSADEDPPETTEAAARVVDAAALAPARCSAASKKGSLGSIVDVGDAILTPNGFAIGLVRKDEMLSVATVSADLGTVTFADVGKARLEAPPPLPFLWDGNVYVAWIDSGDLRIGRVDGTKVALVADTVVDLVAHSAKQAPISDLPDLDVAVTGDHGVVVWDHETPNGSEIRTLAFDKNGFAKIDAGTSTVSRAGRNVYGRPEIDSTDSVADVSTSAAGRVAGRRPCAPPRSHPTTVVVRSRERMTQHLRGDIVLGGPSGAAEYII